MMFWVQVFDDGEVVAVVRRSSGATVNRFDRDRGEWVEWDGDNLSRAIEGGDMGYEGAGAARGEGERMTFWAYLLSTGGVGGVFRRSSGGKVDRFDRERRGWVEVDGDSLSRAIAFGGMD